jgi:hypothetical protein
MTNWKHEKEQKSKIKIIRTGVEISLTKRIIINFLEEGERQKKKPYRRETALPTSTCAASTRKEQDN